MKKKKIVADLKIKLNDLKNNDKIKYEGLNDFSKSLNDFIEKLNLQFVKEVVCLHSGQSNYSLNPSTTESSKRIELINRYSEALTEINPNHGKNILTEFKESSSIFKLVNISVIISSGILFFAIGNSVGNNKESDIKDKSVIQQSNPIKDLIIKDSVQ